jgi:hypothetical protein
MGLRPYDICDNIYLLVKENVMEITASLLNPNPTDGFLTVVIDGKQHTILASNPMFASAVSAYQAKDFDALMLALDPSRKFLNLYAKYEQIEVKDGSVFVDGDAIQSVVADRIINFLADGVDCLPIFKFITRLQLNPSKRAVDELYTFLEHKHLPLTETGTFLAYKAVRNDYTDKHTGKFFNGVGEVLSMPRNKVDDDKNVGCSYGFHAGTLRYASEFASGSDKMVLVEIDPADVVSIPTDCEFQKLRTCRYKVVAEYERPLDEHVYESRFSTDNDDDVDEEWDDDDDDDGRFACSGCGWNRHMCEECEYCVECCDCSQDDEELEADEEQPKVEVQLTLNLDNKVKEINWDDQLVLLETLIKHLFSSRRPALAMAVRREYGDSDQHKVRFGVLLDFTTQADAKTIYNELNP